MERSGRGKGEESSSLSFHMCVGMPSNGPVSSQGIEGLLLEHQSDGCGL